MEFDQKLIAGKLHRWKKNMQAYSLPDWDSIPDIGLYMVQVIEIMKQYLSYLPSDVKEEQYITAATVNNYVRMKVMPAPEKKRYYRKHIAYLIIIMSLKHNMSIGLINKILPITADDETVKATYVKFVEMHKRAVETFIHTVELSASKLLDADAPESPYVAQSTSELILGYTILSGFAKLMSEKLLLLDKSPSGKDSAAKKKG